jgi:hypothetical protein
MRARIAAVGVAYDPFAALKRVQHPSKPRTLDAKRLPNGRLRTARVCLNDKQDRILRRTYIKRSKRANEVSEHPKLQAAQEIAKVAVELAKRKFFRPRR